MTATEAIPADEALHAKEFTDLRLTQFKKLAVRVKKLVLEIVQYYLSAFHPLDLDAALICNAIEACKHGNDEAAMIKCYQDFLNFLPIALKVSVQRNLFRQPSSEEVAASNSYKNDLTAIIKYNEILFKEDEIGMNKYKELLLTVNNIPDPDQITDVNFTI